MRLHRSLRWDADGLMGQMETDQTCFYCRPSDYWYNLENYNRDHIKPHPGHFIQELYDRADSK